MNPQITLIVSGKNFDADRFESAFAAVPEIKLQPCAQERGVVSGAAKAVKWVAEFIGSSGKVADLLIDQATKELAGATIEIQVAGISVKLGNVNRSQIIAVLDHAVAIARQQSGL